MPYSITTKDGITIDNIPDDVPANSPELKARVAKVRGQSTEPATLTQKASASVPGRIIQGLRDPIDAGAQMLVRAVPDPVRRVVDNFGNWLSDLGFPVSVSKGVEGVDQMISENERRYQEARMVTNGGQDPGMDLARGAGTFLSPVNMTIGRFAPGLGGMTTAGKVGVGAGFGAAGGAFTPVTDTSNGDFATQKALQAGFGAVSGAALTPAVAKFGESLGRLANRWVGDPSVTGARASVQTDALIRQALAETGQTIDDVPQDVMQGLRQQVLDSLKRGTKLDPAAMLRQADARTVGVRLTQGQLTRDPMQFAAERNLRGVAGVGDPLLQRMTQQNQRFQQVLNQDMGANRAAEAVPAGRVMIDALGAADDAARVRVGAAYTAARGSDAVRSELNLRGLSQDYSRIINDYGTKNIPQPVASRLEQMGLLSGTQRKVVTVADAEDLLQVINKNRSNDPAINSALGEIRQAVQRAVTTAEADGGPFTAARAMARQRFEQLDAIPALRAVADGDAMPDDFVQKFIVNGKTDQVNALARVLRGQNPQAFEEARSQIGATLARAAFGENPAGDSGFAVDRFNKALRQLGSEKLRAFMTPDEINRLAALGRVASYVGTVPAHSAVNFSNTSSAALNLMQGLPGFRQIAAMAQRGVAPIRDARVVSSALNEAVPQTAADLPPEIMRALSSATALGGVAAGGLGAVPFR